MMSHHLLLRSAQAILALLALSIMAFFVMRQTDKALDLSIHVHPTQEEFERFEGPWRLDKPMVAQYFLYIKDVLQGDWGESWKWESRSLDIVHERFLATLKLVSITLSLSVALGLTLGVLAAMHRGSPFDRAGNIFAILGQSMPSFCLGIVLLWVFAVLLGWPPTSGREGTAHLILPAITIGLFLITALMRITRSAMVEALDSDYVTLARIKGLSEWNVIVKHCLRNVALEYQGHFVLLAGFLLTSVVVVETVFYWPGIGRLATVALHTRDYMVLHSVTLFLGAIFILAHLLMDLLSAYLDPRIRFSSGQPVHSH